MFIRLVCRSLQLNAYYTSIQETILAAYNTYTNSIYCKVKLKLFLYRPWRPLGLREVEAPIFSDIRLIDIDKVVSLKLRLHFTPGDIIQPQRE
jgi:hypothetical protein